MKLNPNFPQKIFTIRVKNLNNDFEFLIKRKVYVNSKNEFFSKYSGTYYKIAFTCYAAYLGTITVSQQQLTQD